MTILRRPRPAQIWDAGNVPRQAPTSELVEGGLRTADSLVSLDELGGHLWALIDGTRSAPSLARLLAEQLGLPSLQTALDVHARLESLAEAGAIDWV
jgi:hypothetical protein